MKYLAFGFLLYCSPLLAYYGFYTGGSLGAHLSQGVQSGGTTSTFESTLVSTIDVQKKLFQRSPSGAWYLGSFVAGNSLYLGLESSLLLSHTHLKSSQRGINLVIGDHTRFTTTSTANSYINTFQGGFDLIPGFFFNPGSLFYGRVGVGVARVKLDTNNENVCLIDFALGQLSTGSSDNDIFSTLRLGVGLEQRFSSRWFLRADYVFTDYVKYSLKDEKGGLSTGIANFFPVALYSTRHLHLYDHNAMLGLSYRFYSNEPTDKATACLASSFQGLYLGGTMGGSSLTSTQSGSLLGINPNTDLTRQRMDPPTQLYNNQFQGMLYVGYGEAWKTFYLGGEVFTAASTHNKMKYQGKITFQTIGGSTSYVTSYNTRIASDFAQYGSDFRPGVILSPSSLLYARVGVAAAKLKARSNNTFTANNGSGITWSVPESLHLSKWKAAYRLGLGLEQALTSNLHLRADCIYTHLGSISYEDSATGPDTNGRVVILTNTLSARLKNNAILLGLTYYFP